MSFLTEYFDEYRDHPIRKIQSCKPDDLYAKFEGKWLDPKKGKKDKEMTDDEINDFIKRTMRGMRGESMYYNDYCSHHPPGFYLGSPQRSVLHLLHPGASHGPRQLIGPSSFGTRNLSIEFQGPSPATWSQIVSLNLTPTHTEMKTRPHVPRPYKSRFCKNAGYSKDKDEDAHHPLPKLALKDTEVMKIAKELYESDMDEPTLEPIPTHLRIMGYCRPPLFKTGLSEYQESIGRLAYELVRDDRIKRCVLSNGGRAAWGYPPEAARQPLLDGVPFDGERLY